MEILSWIAAYLAAGVAVAVWAHFKTEPIDRLPFGVTLLYCLALWWLVILAEFWTWVMKGR